MADLSLNILVTPTYDKTLLAVMDISTYTADPPVVTTPTIDITLPGYDDAVSLTFVVQETNVFNSEDLGLSASGEDLIALPDGVYTLTYSVDPAATNYVTKNIMRTEKIQETFDEAFMQLDMMECDKAIKKQSKINLSTVYFFIQASIAAANNCAVDEANTLYAQASKMLTNFIKSNCGCSGAGYLTSFY